MTKPIELPRLASPAQRALASAGIRHLNDLAGFRESDIARLHGIGPNALTTLKETMRINNIQFLEE